MIDANRNFIFAAVRRTVLQCLPYTDVSDPNSQSLAREVYNTPECRAIKAEIVSTGRKLWERRYVDGNGGNISYRLGHDLVLCTPTLCSKGDLEPSDFSLVNLNNQRVVGERTPTSEILLHLEIYKAVSSARAVIHCHPPHATAYAITGLIPPDRILPEQEVFVGPVRVAPYETPGTAAFAETVLPYAQRHNTILLENHGVVCWSDSVSHAEWLVEVIDTYCQVLILAAQLGVPIKQIPADKIADLLDIKRRLGFPDARLPNGSSQCGEGLPAPGSSNGGFPSAGAARGGPEPDYEFNHVVSKITEEIMGFLARKTG